MADFEDEHMDAIRALPVDALVGRGWTKPTKQSWFAYFWAEAANEINRSKFYAYREPILRFFNHAFDLPPAWNGRGGSRRVDRLTFRNRRNWDSLNDVLLLNMMEALLFIGFERFRGSMPDGLPPNDSSYQLQQFVHGYGREKLIKFVWRGEGRGWRDIVESGVGLTNKAQSDFRPANAPTDYKTFSETQLMREPWHPFSIERVRQDYWFRLTSADNCCESVVSVTPDVKSALTFPRMADKGVWLETIPIPRLLAARHPDGRINGTAVSRIGGTVNVPNLGMAPGEVIKYADQVQLYLCLIEQYFDTQERQRQLEADGLTSQESFPELAVKEVPAADIIGMITFARVFHGVSDADGFTMLFHKGLSKAPTYARVRDRYLKKRSDHKKLGQILAQANTVFDGAAALHGTAIKWTGAGAAPVAAALKGFPTAGRGIGPFTRIDRVERTNGSATAFTPLWP